MLRHRRRRRDRPRPRALRTFHEHPDFTGQQRHHRTHLPERYQQRTARRIPRQDRAGHPAHHRRNQTANQVTECQENIRRYHHRDRRHGRRHRIVAVHRSRPAAPLRTGSEQLAGRAPDPDSVHGRVRRTQDQADPAFGQAVARKRPAARRAGTAHRKAPDQRHPAQSGAVLQRGRQCGRRIDRRTDDLRSAADDAEPETRSGGAR